MEKMENITLEQPKEREIIFADALKEENATFEKRGSMGKVDVLSRFFTEKAIQAAQNAARIQEALRVRMAAEKSLPIEERVATMNALMRQMKEQGGEDDVVQHWHWDKDA